MIRRPSPGRISAVAFSALVVVAAVVMEHADTLSATYYADAAWSRPVLSSIRSAIATDAVLADAPTLRDPFSVQWAGYVFSRRTADHEFRVIADGPTILFIDGARVSDAGGGQAASATLRLARGLHTITLRYVHLSGSPRIELSVDPQSGLRAATSSVTLSPQPRGALWYAARSVIAPLAAAILIVWTAAGVVLIVRHVPPVTVVVVVVVTVACLIGIVHDVPSWIRGPDPAQWQWGYQIPATGSRWWPAAAAGGGLLVLGLYVALRTELGPLVRATIGIVGSVVLGLAFHLALLHFAPHGAAAALAERTMSADMTSYFGVAADQRFEIRDFLRTYADEMPRRERHASSHPPGPILFYRAAIVFFQRSPGAAEGVLSGLERVGVHRSQLTEGAPVASSLAAAAVVSGLLVVFSAALTAWPVAIIARAMGAGAVAAAQTAILWQFCLSPALFAPQFDQVITLLAASVCAIGCVALRAESRAGLLGWAFAAGLFAGVSVFCSFGAPPMILAAAILALAVTRASHRTWRRVTMAVSAAALGAAIAVAIPVLAGYEFLRTATEALAISRYDYMLKREYWTWVRFDLLDFGIFLGPPLLAAAAAALLSRRRAQSTLSPRLDVLATIVGFVLVLDVSGVTRGEIARLWMPLYPLVFVALMPVSTRSDEASESSRRFAAWCLLLGSSLALICVALRLYWDPA